MYWQSKITWSELIIIFALYKVNRHKGDHVSDAITIAGATFAVAAVWAPEIRLMFAGAVATTASAPAAAIAAPVAIGFIASGFVGGQEGMKNYMEFMTGEVSPEEYYAVVMPEVKRQLEKPLGVGALVYRLALSETNRRLTQIEEGASALYGWVEDLPGTWRNPTWGIPYV